MWSNEKKWNWKYLLKWIAKILDSGLKSFTTKFLSFFISFCRCNIFQNAYSFSYNIFVVESLLFFCPICTRLINFITYQSSYAEFHSNHIPYFCWKIKLNFRSYKDFFVLFFCCDIHRRLVSHCEMFEMCTQSYLSHIYNLFFSLLSLNLADREKGEQTERKKNFCL